MDSEKLKICVHCGLCLEACPTYRILKNEADSPRGRIALMRGVSEESIPMTETVMAHLDACLDCQACQTVCPAGVPYGEIIEEGRAELYGRIKKKSLGRALTRFFLTQVLAKPSRLRIVGRWLRFYQCSGLRALVEKSGFLKFFPGWLESGEALLPEISAIETLEGKVSKREDRVQFLKSRVLLFRGCIASILFPQIEVSAIQVLEACGCAVDVPEEQVCCGALLAHAGFEEDFKKLERENMSAFSRADADYIAVTAAGCGSTLKRYGESFSKKVRDISEILRELGPPKGLSPLPLRVTYQDACHLVHAQGIKSQPREILRWIPGLELLDLPHGDWCCGSAGIYNITHPEIAKPLLREKIADILSVKPDLVAVGNPGCALQIRMGLNNSGSRIRVVHPVELLAKSLTSGS